MYYFWKGKIFRFLGSSGDWKTSLILPEVESHGSPHEQPNINIIQLLFLFSLLFVVSVNLLLLIPSLLHMPKRIWIGPLEHWYSFGQYFHTQACLGSQLIDLQNGCPWIWCLLVLFPWQLFWPSFSFFSGAVGQELPSEGGCDHCRHNPPIQENAMII